MLKIVYMEARKLVPYAKNSRTHTEEQIAQIANSIKEFGFTNPILIDEEGMIIAGHGRVLASEKLQILDVPTITLSGLTEEQKRAYIIADNKIADNAGWDEDLLLAELKDLTDAGFDFEGIIDVDINMDYDTEYKPVLDPESEKREVTDADIERAQVDVIDRSKYNTKSVICPHCFEEFEINE